jgi:hypothetical protein
MGKRKSKFVNRSDRPPATVVARRREAVAGMLGTKTQAEIAEVVGAPLRTIERDTAALRRNFRDGEQFAEFVKGLVELYISDYEETRACTLPPEVSSACRGILDSIARITGANAPSKSLSVSVDASGDPAKLIGYRKFVYETRFLDGDSLEQVFAFCRTLNTPPPARVFNPPTTSELWEDEPKQLIEGDSE